MLRQLNTPAIEQRIVHGEAHGAGPHDSPSDRHGAAAGDDGGAQDLADDDGDEHGRDRDPAQEGTSA